MRSSISKKTAALLGAVALSTAPVFVLGGCAEGDGPAEEVGESIDDAAEETGDAVEDAADEVEDAADG